MGAQLQEEAEANVLVFEPARGNGRGANGCSAQRESPWSSLSAPPCG